MKQTFFFLILGCFLMADASGQGSEQAGSSKQIWLGGVDPVAQSDRHTTNPPDYMDLFKPDAPWSTGAAATNVFKVGTAFMLRGTDDQLRTMIEGLKSRHIALAVEFGVLTGSDTCGKGIEGFGSPAAADALCKRIQKLGGQLDYIAMDEPVTWGHEKEGTIAKKWTTEKILGRCCQYPLPELVARASVKIATLQRYFPNVKIGLIDAVNGRYPHLGADIVTFIDLLQKATGLKLAFMHMDVSWDSDWRPQMELLVQRLRDRHIRIGVVFDGDVEASSDKQWIEQALGHYKDITRNPATAVDDLVFQTWTPRPAKMLPETDPTAWTYALKYAVTVGK